MDTDESEGRFLVHHSGYLDPAIYRSGRHLTVVGEVMGGKSLKIGEAEYRYPVLTSKFLHLWAKAHRYYGPNYYPYYYPIYPYGGLYYNWLLYYHYPLWPYWYEDYPHWRHPRKK
jgi:outer membrane lipoprotein